MDEKIPNDVNEPQVPEQAPVAPTHENEDAQQFSKWMAEYGRPALIGLAVAVVALLGIQVWRGQKESKAAAAVQALFQSNSPEELQQLASADPEAPTAPMALASAAAEHVPRISVTAGISEPLGARSSSLRANLLLWMQAPHALHSFSDLKPP